jgi:hypothetical protein
MSVRSANPPSASIVYVLLIIAGVVAMALSASAIGWIVYSYVNDEERRNPPPVGTDGHASLPDWIVSV